MDSEELDFITDRRARKAIIEAGYDTLEKAHAAGEEVITDLRYVGRLTWEEIEAEELRQARAEMEAVDDQPPGEPAELPVPPVVYEPPPGDPQEVPEGESADLELLRRAGMVDFSSLLGHREPNAGGFDSKLLAALEGEGSLEAAYGAIEDSLIAQRDDGIGNVAGVEVDELMRSYVASLTLLRERDKAPLLQALLMGWIRQTVDLGLVPDVSEWVRTSKVPDNPSPALAALLPYEQVYLEPPAEPWPVR